MMKSKLVIIIVCAVLALFAAAAVFALISNNDCDHVTKNVVEENRAEASCTETGSYDEVTYCADCDTELLREKKTVPVIAHSEVKDEPVEPSCEKNGKTEGRHCSVCDTVLAPQEDIAALGHVYDDEYDESCNRCGVDREVACAHTELETVLGKAPSCTEEGITDGAKCKKCGEIIIEQNELPALGHAEITVAGTEPTCDEMGATEGKSCAVCLSVLVSQEKIPALGHDEVSHAAKGASCTEIGWDAYVTCSRCDYTTYEETPVTDHIEHINARIDPTCTTEGRTEGKYCLNCGMVISEQADIPKLPHDYDDKYDDSCNVCGFVRDAACAHTDLEVLSARPATCTTPGLSEGRKCRKCEEIVAPQVEISALGHTEVIDVRVDPT